MHAIGRRALAQCSDRAASTINLNVKAFGKRDMYTLR
jgi:hypothetical protein